MIANMFGDTKKEGFLPRDVNDAVSQCRKATQEALQNRISRMDIEFPVGTQFGVEPRTKRKKDETPTRRDFEQSDRELARVFVEMFQPVGGENIVVGFNGYDQAEAARKKWKGNLSATARVLSLDRRRTAPKRKAKTKGFAAKMAEEVDEEVGGAFKLPENAEVALFVAPGPKELIVIERICQEMGMGTLVILLNARLDSVSNYGSDEARELFQNEFETIFRLAAAPQEEAPGCLLYRTYQSPWLLARKASVGPPKTILSQPDKPSPEQCRQAFESLELSDMERSVENALENVANWLR